MMIIVYRESQYALSAGGVLTIQPQDPDEDCLNGEDQASAMLTTEERERY